MKHSYNATRLSEYETDLELLWVSLKVGSTSIIVGSCYRPSCSNVSVFDNIVNNVEHVLQNNQHTILMGDLNISYNCKESNLLEQVCHMKQLILDSTRVTPSSSSIIDHKYTIDETKHILSGVIKITLSDHYAVYTILSFKQIRTQPTQPRILTCRNFNIDAFLTDLDYIFTNQSNIYENSVDIDNLWNIWKHDFQNVIQKHAPLRNLRLKARNNPWFNHTIQNMIYHRNHIHKHAILSKNRAIFQEYRRVRNNVNNVIKQAKSEYFKSSVNEFKFQPKKMWQTLKTVLPSKRKTLTTVPFSSNDLVEFYSSIGDKINSKFDPYIKLPDMSTILNDVHSVFSFDDISNDFVFKKLLSLSNVKTIDILGFDGQILAIAAPLISESLTKIFNASLRTGIVPSDWKLARVTPLFKGNGPKDVMGNYRPISVISHISKIIECHVKDCLVKYLVDNSLLRHHQFAYLKRSRQRVMDINLDVSISNETLQQVAASKFLGLIVDSSIQWSEHVDYLIKKLSPKLGLLYRLSKFLPQDSLKTIYYDFNTS